MSILKKVALLSEQDTPDEPQTSPLLTPDDCESIIAECIKAAEGAHLLMNIAIVDHTGDLCYFVRMPGAWNGSIEIAQSKAYTAFAFSGD
jgi:uncharacterized protein GlcG (DUF336 family)